MSHFWRRSRIIIRRIDSRRLTIGAILAFFNKCVGNEHRCHSSNEGGNKGGDTFVGHGDGSHFEISLRPQRKIKNDVCVFKVI